MLRRIGGCTRRRSRGAGNCQGSSTLGDQLGIEDKKLNRRLFFELLGTPYISSFGQGKTGFQSLADCCVTAVRRKAEHSFRQHLICPDAERRQVTGSKDIR